MLNWLVAASKLHKHRETCCTAEWPFYSFILCRGQFSNSSKSDEKEGGGGGGYGSGIKSRNIGLGKFQNRPHSCSNVNINI